MNEYRTHVTRCLAEVGHAMALAENAADTSPVYVGPHVVAVGLATVRRLLLPYRAARLTHSPVLVSGDDLIQCAESTTAALSHLLTARQTEGLPVDFLGAADVAGPTLSLAAFTLWTIVRDKAPERAQASLRETRPALH